MGSVLVVQEVRESSSLSVNRSASALEGLHRFTETAIGGDLSLGEPTLSSCIFPPRRKPPDSLQNSAQIWAQLKGKRISPHGTLLMGVHVSTVRGT